MCKTPHVHATFGSCDVEKKCTPLWRKRISKSKCTKHTSSGPLLEVRMWKKCTLLWREVHFQVKMDKTLHVCATFGGSDVGKVHAVLARSTFPSQNAQNTTCSEVRMWKKCAPLWREAHVQVKMDKASHVRATFGGSDVRRKFRSQTSDNMDRWKAEQGRGREKRKIRREKSRRERVRKKMEMREKVGKSRFTAFFHWFVAPEGRKVGSLKRRVRSQLARGEMKNCTPLCREAHFQVKMYKPHTIVGRLLEVAMLKKCTLLWRQVHFQVKMYRTHQDRTTFGSWDVEKVHTVVAPSTFPSQNVQNTPGSDHFWKLRCRKSARRCGAKHISKSKCIKHTSSGPLLEVRMWKKCTLLWREVHFQVKMDKTLHVCAKFGGSDVGKVHAVLARSTFPSQNVQNTTFAPLLEVRMLKKCAPLWREAHFEVNMLKTPGVRTTFGGSDVASLRFTTIHYITLHYTSLHYTTLHYLSLRFTTLHYTTTTTTQLHSTTLHYTTLRSSTLNYTTLHYTTLHYTTLHSTTPHNYTTTTTLNDTPLH